MDNKKIKMIKKDIKARYIEKDYSMGFETGKSMKFILKLKQ